jgi:hypothetical protein
LVSCARKAASRTASASVRSRPKATLSASVIENRNDSWGTMAILDRRV